MAVVSLRSYLGEPRSQPSPFGVGGARITRPLPAPVSGRRFEPPPAGQDALVPLRTALQALGLGRAGLSLARPAPGGSLARFAGGLDVLQGAAGIPLSLLTPGSTARRALGTASGAATLTSGLARSFPAEAARFLPSGGSLALGAAGPILGIGAGALDIAEGRTGQGVGSLVRGGLGAAEFAGRAFPQLATGAAGPALQAIPYLGAALGVGETLLGNAPPQVKLLDAAAYAAAPFTLGLSALVPSVVHALGIEKELIEAMEFGDPAFKAFGKLTAHRSPQAKLRAEQLEAGRIGDTLRAPIAGLSQAQTLEEFFTRLQGAHIGYKASPAQFAELALTNPMAIWDASSPGGSWSQPSAMGVRTALLAPSIRATVETAVGRMRQLLQEPGAEAELARLDPLFRDRAAHAQAQYLQSVAQQQEADTKERIAQGYTGYAPPTFG